MAVSLSSRFQQVGFAAAGLILAAAPIDMLGAQQRGQAADDAQQPWPQQARLLPDPETLPLPHEREIFSSIVTKLASEPSERASSILPSLNSALARLNEPTELRGFVQYLRSGLLLLQGQNGEAIEAVEESIRLLRGYSGPLIAAASIYGYNNRPDVGTDYLLRASQVDPVSVRMLDDYEVDNLLRRLHAMHDERRVRALSDRLLAINWVGRRFDSQSRLASEAIERRIDEGDVTGARALISKLLLPDHSRNLLIDRRYAEIWSDVEKWAGPRFEKQWPIYLSESRERWSVTRDALTLADYVNALAAAGHDQTLLREALPVFARTLDRDRDADLVFVVTPVAGALARESRWDEVEQLFEKAAAAWPLGSDENALNVAANRARYLLYADRPSEALKQMDAAIADARKWGTVNADAIAAMHHYRACMLHELGRTTEAAASIALAASIEAADDVAALHVCTDNAEQARGTLLNALQVEEKRDNVIAFMQPPSQPPLPSDYGRKQRDAADALRRDPELIRAVERYGRILAYPVNVAAPKERL